MKFAEPGSWWFELSGGGAFSTHGGTWRLSSLERMLACSDDHLHPFGLPAPFDALRTARDALGNARVVGARVRDHVPDLEIRLSNGLILEVLALSAGYECWETCDPAGRCVVVNGSRDASTWKK